MRITDNRDMAEMERYYEAQIEYLKTELTKARQLIRDLSRDLEGASQC